MNESFVEAKSLLYNVKRTSISFKYYPHRATLNYYIGCQFGCKYCYAWFSVKNYGFDITEFPTTSIIKNNTCDILEKELNKKSWKNYKGIIQLGNLQDVYQPIESKYQLTRSVIQKLYEHNKSCGILSKSTLMLKDIDLLKKMAERNLIQVDISIAYTNEALKKCIEPFAPSISARFNALKKMSDEGISTGIFVDPAIPYFTLNEIEEIFQRGKDAGINYIFIGSLHMRYWKYNILKDAINRIYKGWNIDSYMLFKDKVYLKQEYFNDIIKKAYECSIKYSLPLASPYPQYTTCDFNFGSFINRHPLIYDYLNVLIKYKNKYVTIDLLTNEFNERDLEKSYYTSLKWFWDNNKLFNGLDFLTIKERNEGDSKEYCLVNDYKLDNYIINNINPFKKTNLDEYKIYP